jgi:DeoR/GlpR family transcriptional regulator of sugar metabolism
MIRTRRCPRKRRKKPSLQGPRWAPPPLCCVNAIADSKARVSPSFRTRKRSCILRLYSKPLARRFEEFGVAARGAGRHRQDRILELIRAHGFVKGSELSEVLGVSTVTIRQDLELLSERGLVSRMFGGAVAGPGDMLDSKASGQAVNKRETKQRIGAAAAGQIQPGETVLLDGGTTTLEVARRLPENGGVTVVTCAPMVALEAVNRAGVTVILCAGQLNAQTLSVTGPPVEQLLRDVRAHRLFLATCSVDLAHGLGEHSFAGAQSKRALIASACQVVLVCDSSKFRASAPMRVASLDVVHQVITDEGVPQPFLDALRFRGVVVDIV